MVDVFFVNKIGQLRLKPNKHTWTVHFPTVWTKDWRTRRGNSFDRRLQITARVLIATVSFIVDVSRYDLICSSSDDPIHSCYSDVVSTSAESIETHFDNVTFPSHNV